MQSVRTSAVHGVERFPGQRDRVKSPFCAEDAPSLVAGRLARRDPSGVNLLLGAGGVAGHDTLSTCASALGVAKRFWVSFDSRPFAHH